MPEIDQLDTPFITVVNLVNNDANIVETILSKDFAVSASPTDNCQRLLSIACKYYTADVVVKCTVDKEEATRAEAIIIYFDGQQSTSWEEAVVWMKLSKTWAIPLRMLVCVSIAGQRFYTTVMRSTLDVHFELIELQPSEDTVEPGDEYGVARIKSAIEAHIWPNMKSLEPTVPTNSHGSPESEKALEPASTCTSSPGDDSRSQAGGGSADRQHQVSSDVDSVTDFEKAFASLMEIRAQVAGCTDKARRHRLAEKLTVKFWRAIGGPEDEMEGLRSSTDSSDSDSGAEDQEDEEEKEGEQESVAQPAASRVPSS